MLNTVTVFAYEDIQYRYVGNTEEGNNKELASGYLTGDVIFVEEGYEGEYEGVWQEFMEIYDQVVLYDVQFIDEEGNIYPVNTDIGLCEECTHVYRNGEVSEHVVNEDGSCTFIRYKAQQCTKCGWTDIGEEYARFEYKVCTHISDVNDND